jgi:hypothetical protein
MELHVVLAQIDSHSKEVYNTFNSLTAKERGWRPDPTMWSINQHLEHLIMLNESYFPEFQRVQRGERSPVFTLRIPVLPDLLGRMILSAVHPQNQRKMKTYSIWHPTITPSDVDIVLKFERHHSQLKEKLIELDGLLNRSVIISSPANKWIVYPLETAIEIMLLHEQRHIQHAKKLLEFHLL